MASFESLRDAIHSAHRALRLSNATDRLHEKAIHNDTSSRTELTWGFMGMHSRRLASRRKRAATLV